MSAHLGLAVTAFVDGELDHGRREEVLTHLTYCAPCRDDVDAVRRLKSALRGSGGPSLPFDLSSRLLAVSMLPQAPVPAAPAPGRRRLPSHPGLRRTAVGGAFLVLGLGGALSLAGPPPRGPVAPVDPTSPRFVVDHTVTSTEVPFAELDVVPVSAR
jgi:anti-sigma factor RsiW